jgi:hypothetical protein
MVFFRLLYYAEFHIFKCIVGYRKTDNDQTFNTIVKITRKAIYVKVNGCVEDGNIVIHKANYDKKC